MDFSQYFQNDPDIMKLISQQRLETEHQSLNFDSFVDVRIFITESLQQKFDGSGLTLLHEYLLGQTEGYLWERDPIVLEAGSCEGEFKITMRFGDAYHDEWYLIHLMRLLTLKYAGSLVVHVVDNDGDPILIEACDEDFPAWMEEVQCDNRLYIFNGAITVLSPSTLSEIHSPRVGSKFILSSSNRGLIEPVASLNKSFMAKLARHEWDVPVHRGLVSLPVLVAKLLTARPQLVSCILDYIPPDKDVQENLSPGRPLSEYKFLTETQTLAVGVKFTRLQWARLKCANFSVPKALARLEIDTARRADGDSLALGSLLLTGLANCILRDPRVTVKTALQKLNGNPPDSSVGQMISEAISELSSASLDTSIPPIIDSDADWCEGEAPPTSSGLWPGSDGDDIAERIAAEMVEALGKIPTDIDYQGSGSSCAEDSSDDEDECDGDGYEEEDELYSDLVKRRKGQ